MVAAGYEETAGVLFSAEEAAFLAQEELVEVQPRANLGTLHLIAADYGPLRPHAAASVPLWLALQLRRAHYCRVIPPAWLSPAALEAAIVRERSAGGPEGDMQPLPYYWAEIAHALLSGPAAEDVPQAERVRAQVQTLAELRMAKLRADMPRIQGEPIMLSNATSAEVQILRPLLCEAMAAFDRINAAQDAAYDAANAPGDLPAKAVSSFSVNSAPFSEADSAANTLFSTGHAMHSQATGHAPESVFSIGGMATIPSSLPPADPTSLFATGSLFPADSQQPQGQQPQDSLASETGTFYSPSQP